MESRRAAAFDARLATAGRELVELETAADHYAKLIANGHPISRPAVDRHVERLHHGLERVRLAIDGDDPDLAEGA